MDYFFYKIKPVLSGFCFRASQNTGVDPKLTIQGIDQIWMIYIRVSSETWLPKVRTGAQSKIFVKNMTPLLL